MQITVQSSPPWLRFAKRYIWWQAPEDAVRTPRRLIAQVMNLGTLPDIAELRGLVSDDTLLQVLAKASPGEFSERSWHFWHQVLGGENPVEVPPLPQRHFA